MAENIFYNAEEYDPTVRFATEITSNADALGWVYTTVKKCALSIEPALLKRVPFDPENITLVGGAISNLPPYRTKQRGIKSLTDLIHRETQDLDIKWWAHRFIKDHALFQRFGKAFSESLSREFNSQECKSIYMEQLNRGKHDKVKEEQVSIRVEQNGRRLTNFSIEVIFVFDDIMYHGKHHAAFEIPLIDIGIHNAINSQEFTYDHRPITNEMNLLDVSIDTMYCGPTNTEIVQVDTYSIRIPTMIAFVRQQLFAFDVLQHNIFGDVLTEDKSRKLELKSYICLLRAIYVSLYVIMPTEQNEMMQALIDEKMDKHDARLRTLCSRHSANNIKYQPILELICSMPTNVNIPQYRMKKISAIKASAKKNSVTKKRRRGHRGSKKNKTPVKPH